jgi:hypothetical protein
MHGPINVKYVFMIYFTKLSYEQIMQDDVKSFEIGCLTFCFYCQLPFALSGAASSVNLISD